MIINNKEFEVLTIEDFKKALSEFEKGDDKNILCSKREFDVYLQFGLNIMNSQMNFIKSSDFIIPKTENKTPVKDRVTKLYTKDYGNISAFMDKELSLNDKHCKYAQIYNKIKNDS